MRPGRAAALAACAVFAAAVLAFALTPRERQLNTESFEYVWTTIRDKHWQTPPAGLDWQAVHDELRPKIEKAESMEAARSVMREMLSRLHQSHFAIIPSAIYSDLAAAVPEAGDGTPGLDIRIVDSRALVAHVEPGFDAASQGVGPGWIVARIGDYDVDPIVRKLGGHDARQAVLARLSGPAGRSIRVEFLDGANTRVFKSLRLGNPKGTLAQFGYLTPQFVWFDSKTLFAGKVGYVRFNFFLDPARLMNQFGQAVESCGRCEGFIIDVRGNRGGMGIMAMGMAGWFIDKPDQRLGTFYLRDSTLNLVVNPRADIFPGPLAILVDEDSASTSEILAGGLQDLKRARVFGNRTAAAALPSVFEKLPNGDGFQYAVANYISEGGKPLEGFGVTPDVDTPITREALLQGKDPALDAAIAWIEMSSKREPAARPSAQ